MEETPPDTLIPTGDTDRGSPRALLPRVPQQRGLWLDLPLPLPLPVRVQPPQTLPEQTRWWPKGKSPEREPHELLCHRVPGWSGITGQAQ